MPVTKTKIDGNVLRLPVQLVETPVSLAERMAEWARPLPTDTLLEPSAGRGRLVEPFVGKVAGMTLVDIDDDNTDYVAGRFAGAHVIMEDFLLIKVPQADIISMNPPLTGNQGLGHIMYAWRFLKPGGRLVAISSEHAFSGKEGICHEFRKFLELIGAEVEKLPPETFKESGASVEARMIRAVKVA